MKKIVALGLILAMVLSIAACSGSSSKAIAKVDDVEITQDMVDQYFPLFAQGQFNMTDLSALDKNSETYAVVQKAAVEDLVSLEVIKNNYEKQKRTDIVPKTSEKEFDDFYKNATSDEQMNKFIEQYNITEEFMKEFFVKQYYVEAFYQEITKSMGDIEGKITQYYNEHQDEFYAEEVKASHILVDTEDDAKVLRERVLAGEDFATLAKENSVDPTAIQNSGELGYFGKGKMVAEFEAAAFALEIGEISEPVKTSYGYHIIKLEDKKSGIKTLEEVHDDIYMNLFDEVYLAKLDEIKKDMKIEIDGKAVDATADSTKEKK